MPLSGQLAPTSATCTSQAAGASLSPAPPLQLLLPLLLLLLPPLLLLLSPLLLLPLRGC